MPGTPLSGVEGVRSGVPGVRIGVAEGSSRIGVRDPQAGVCGGYKLGSCIEPSAAVSSLSRTESLGTVTTLELVCNSMRQLVSVLSRTTPTYPFHWPLEKSIQRGDCGGDYRKMTTCLSLRVSLNDRLRESKELTGPEGALRDGERKLRGPGDDGGKCEVLPGKLPGKSPGRDFAPSAVT